MNRYPRDMTGYGAKPPAANWPNGAKIAVQIVLNYEEGGENNVLHGDAASEAFLSEITGASAMARSASLEHGINLRIRITRRFLARPPDAKRFAGDSLRRGHRLGPRT